MKSIILMTAVCLLVSVGTVSHAAEFSRKDPMPETMDVVVRCSNTDAFLQSVKQSPIGKLVTSKEMKPFWNDQDPNDLMVDFFQRYKGNTANDRQRQSIILEELKMLNREVVAGLNFSTKETFYLTVEITEDNFKKSLVLDKELARLDDLEYFFKKEKFQGVVLHTMITKDGEKETKMFQGFLKGTLVLSNDRQWIERSIVQLKKQSVTTPSGNPMVSLWVRPGVVDTFMERINQAKTEHSSTSGQDTAPDNPKTEIDIEIIVHALGLKQFQGMTVTAEMKADSSKISADVSNGGGPTGIWSIISKQNVSTGYRLPFVPSDFITYGVMSLDFNRFWNQIPEIIKKISPEMIQKYNTVIGTLNAILAVDLSRDLFSNLTSTVFSYSTLPETGQTLLYGFELKDGIKSLSCGVTGSLIVIVLISLTTCLGTPKTSYPRSRKSVSLVSLMIGAVILLPSFKKTVCAVAGNA